MRPLGKTQVYVLKSMLPEKGWRGGGWYHGCGWVWDTPSGTERICQALAARGMVKITRAVAPNRVDRYDITKQGEEYLKQLAG